VERHADELFPLTVDELPTGVDQLDLIAIDALAIT
jgi:hypothetical protein